MRAIVHIGMHRTGTTSVKSYFKGHRKALLKQGILYPFSIGDLGRNAVFEPKYRDTVKKIFAKELTQIPDDGTVFLSSENYFEMGDDDTHTMVGFLDHFGLDVSILCYLRPQAEHIASYYQRYLLPISGGTTCICLAASEILRLFTAVIK